MKHIQEVLLSSVHRTGNKVKLCTELRVKMISLHLKKIRLRTEIIVMTVISAAVFAVLEPLSVWRSEVRTFSLS